MGYDMQYADAAEIMDEIAATTPTFAGVSFAASRRGGLDAVAGQRRRPARHADHARGRVRPRQGHCSSRRSTCRPPSGPTAGSRCILTTGRILTQYNVGAQTRRTANNTWHPEDVLEIHPADAEMRGISTGDLVELTSRVGSTTLRAKVSERMPAGVVYTTFHHPVTGANVVTTENSDWATNCPEYKVTAVQVGVANARGETDLEAARRRRDGRVRRAPVSIAPEARLGNDIARQFAHLPQDEAVAAGSPGTCERFWDPRMRANLHALVRAGDADLEPRVVAAAMRVTAS